CAPWLGGMICGCLSRMSYLNVADLASGLQPSILPKKVEGLTWERDGSLTRERARSIGADAHCRLNRVVAHKKLAQSKGVALAGTIGDVDLAHLVTQMPGLRDEIPQEILDALGPLVGDIAVDL